MPDADDPQPDPLSELARQRREQVEAEIGRSRPEIVESVMQSEVIYTLRPQAIPYEDIDPALLDERLTDLYGVAMDQLNIAPLLQTMSREEVLGLQGAALLRQLVRTTGSSLSWSTGRFPLRNDFVKIRSLAINFERVYVSIEGTSQVAEVIAQEVLEILWDVAGVRKKFADVKPSLIAVGYATGTRLNIEMPFETILNAAALAYLRQNMQEGEKFGHHMGSSAPTEFADRQIATSILLDDVVFRVSTYDVNSGSYSKHELSLGVPAQSDFGKGRVYMRSTLPYERHVTLASGLFGALAAD